jgi:deazaflavin-dependent oxidoreductase (nitroreductase family)
MGIQSSLMTEIETIGRRTGLARRVPLSVAFDATGAWIISQHGTRSGWGANVEANPNVLLRQGDRWRPATAVLVRDDDVAARVRTFADKALLGALVAATFRGLATTPISVRATFTD